jgi:proteasome accessory factor A
MLETDFLKLADRVDWVAKYALLDEFRQEEGLPWNDSHIQSLDLAYHNIDRDEGLYYGLEEAGVMRKLVTDSRVDAAVSCAPEDTRAYLRGLIIKRFGPAVKNTGWNGIVFHHNGEDLLFDMNPLVEANVKILNDEFSSAETLDQVVELLRRSGQNN